MDWLEVRLPQTAPFRPRVNEVLQAVVRGGKVEQSAVRGSEHYAAVVDLRKFDIADAFLHIGKKRGENRDHKVQMIGTGQFSWAQHMDDLEAIVDTNPLRLQPMRTDLTADVENVPVAWALRHARVAGKRFGGQIGRMDNVDAAQPDRREEYMAMGTREIQTIYSGKQPNCFRVYNKTAERMRAYRSFVRGWTPREPKWSEWYECACRDGELRQKGLSELRKIFDIAHAEWEAQCIERGPRPTFREFCGMEESQVLTRFERQIGAQQVGKLYMIDDPLKRPIFTTLGDLKRWAPEFNPFHAVSFAKPGRPDPPLPNGENYSLMTYMAGMYFRQRILEEGRDRAIAWATPLAFGNMKKILERIEVFFPAEAEDAGTSITEAELYERYRTAMNKQLAA